MLSLGNILGKKGRVYFNSITISELEQELLPDKELGYVGTKFDAMGFSHNLSFFTKTPKIALHPEIRGPHAILQQQAKSRSIAEIEAFEGKTIVDIILTGHRTHPLYTDEFVYRVVAQEIRNILQGGPVFCEYTSRATGRLESVILDAEIWGCMNLFGPLTQKEIASYIGVLSRVPVMRDISITQICYAQVAERDYNKLHLTLRERAEFVPNR